MSEVQYWLPEGTIVGNRYEILDVLGIGGYGITYRGRDTRLDILVAVKEYFPSFWATRYTHRDLNVHCMREHTEEYEKGIDRFLGEAKTLVSLSKVPEVVSVTDFFKENDTAYLVMEFLDGQNLKQMAGGFGGRIPPEVLIPVLEPLVKALGKIHETGMIHRDLSPDNIMMLEDGTVRLIDFGNARDTSDNKSMTMAMKQGFAPPEQYRSKGQGTYTDVYGLCATMYYCMTGKLPPQAMDRLTGTPFPTPTELGISISPIWESAIMDGLELFVQKRIQNMEELWERLYGSNVSEPLYSEVLLSQSEERSMIFSEDLKQQSYAKTMPTEEFVQNADVEKSAENFEKALQSGFDKIRNICVQIYKKLKEK